MSNDPITEYTLKGRYNDLDSKRSGLLDTARQCSALTVPSLLPPEGHNINDPLPLPYQGLGARAVQNLASKLLLTLLPPNSPFFKLSMDVQVIEELKAQLGEQGLKTTVDSKLRQIEEIVTKYIEETAIRVVLFRALKYLIVTGNALLDLSDERGRVHRMDAYVLRRNSLGDAVEIIIREIVDITEVPEELQDEARNARHGLEAGKTDGVELYTGMVWNGKLWDFHQEILGHVLGDSEGTYTRDTCPFVPLAWNRNDGDDWGSGHVQDNIGDFNSYEGLRKAITEGALAAARLIFLADPNGMTDVADLQRTPNGGFCAGRREDIESVQVDKGADFNVAQAEARTLEEQLSAAFLMMQSIQRKGERVTAEEIRTMAQELEDTLGGIYSTLALELQLPMVKVLLKEMTRRKKLPSLPDDITPTITTGFEALGRGHDLRKLETFLQYLQPFGPAEIAKRINVSDYSTRVATSLGLNTDGLVKTEQEIQQAEQQALILQMAQQGMSDGAGPLAQAMGNAIDPTKANINQTPQVTQG